MEVKDPLTHAVIGAALEVHPHRGSGLLESVNQKCFEQDFSLRGLPCQPQARIALAYQGRILGDDLIMDFFFPGQLVLEIKAVEKILPIHEAQLLTYLRLSKVAVGLLINVPVPVLRDDLKRMIP